MRLDVESLRAFRAVVECRGVSHAAKRLNITQSAVSWKLKRLEQRVGRPLVVRNGRSLQLTEDGQALLVHAESIVDAHDAAVARFRPDPTAGEVRVGMTEEWAKKVAAVIARFSITHPRLQLSIRMEQSSTLARWLEHGEIDAALIQVCEIDIAEGDAVLDRDRLAWTTGRSELAKRDPIPLVTFGTGCFYRPLMLASLDKAGLRGTIVVEATSAAAVNAAVAAGLGVGVVRKKELVMVVDPDTSLCRAELPRVAQVLRVSPALTPAIAQRLKTVLAENIPALSGVEPHRSTSDPGRISDADLT